MEAPMASETGPVPSDDDRVGVQAILDFIHVQICNRDESNSKRVLTWMSQMCSHPERKPAMGIALAYWGVLWPALYDTHTIARFRAYLKAMDLWARLRSYWRARWIAVYWHALTHTLMAPGGSAEAHDRAAYEANFTGIG